MMHPHIFRGSIGWRMGYGEDYSHKFFDFYRGLTESEQQQYQVMFPEPRLWRGFYNKDFSASDLEDYFSHGVPFGNKHGKATYTRDWLLGEQEAGKRLSYVFFWKPGEHPEDCLGQWQPSVFHGQHLTYSCAEQYMMAEKARVFGDEQTRKQIMEAGSPAKMKSLGQKVRHFEEDVWNQLKYAIVCNGNYLKFSQNKAMREYLLATGDKILVEASPMDRIWGIGLAGEDERAGNVIAWRGQNLLGFALMEVRDDLRRVYQNYDRIDWEQIAEDHA